MSPKINSKATLATLLLSSFASTALAASSCVAFDSNFNLLAFNYGGKDYDAGTQDSWGSGTPNDITASGRPKFDTDGVTCYLAQFYNAIYVLNADKSNPSSIYIYDAGAKSWSTQSVGSGGPDMTSAVSILDHDTNVFYTMSQSKLWALNMDNLKTKASDAAISWESVGNPNFKADGYQPVMGLASNHIHFLNTAGAGKANIFVIHFSYWQPEIQSYSGGEFPAQHGQTASIFKAEGWQTEFAFIPDDGSSTYVINVDNNSTQTLAGPPAKDSSALYATSITALVSSSSQSGIQFLPYTAGSDNSGAKWSKVQKLANLTPASSSGSSSGNTTGSSAGGKPTGTGSSAGSQSTGNSSSAGANAGNGAVKAGKTAILGMFGALVLGSIGVMLI
ncbi:hypothetical protein V5O48_002626 [Marasmius crinis-equi]|uniref:Uncharacterized protein n=1 Tax=Marasmius crinis-equi TaxID=585013 RepID=A0ABR3FVY8_9AGAR